MVHTKNKRKLSSTYNQHNWDDLAGFPCTASQPCHTDRTSHASGQCCIWWWLRWLSSTGGPAPSQTHNGPMPPGSTCGPPHSFPTCISVKWKDLYRFKNGVWVIYRKVKGLEITRYMTHKYIHYQRMTIYTTDKHTSLSKSYWYSNNKHAYLNVWEITVH